MRLDSDVYKSRANKCLDDLLSVQNVDGTMANCKLLRPKKNTKNMMIVDTYFNAEVSSADQFTYKIFQQNAFQNMVNTEIKNSHVV